MKRNFIARPCMARSHSRFICSFIASHTLYTDVSIIHPSRTVGYTCRSPAQNLTSSEKWPASICDILCGPEDEIQILQRIGHNLQADFLLDRHHRSSICAGRRCANTVHGARQCYRIERIEPKLSQCRGDMVNSERNSDSDDACSPFGILKRKQDSFSVADLYKKIVVLVSSARATGAISSGPG
ncbi:hypothetical protein BV25DRAFT_1822925 [Artomyces pyxidatus]|uniref:Uncharacterized protein n=1 Tax=Artomyces pyxidatus TaxID=48021 RepID=A0ACB8T944_9AGAM|nr:hypothetical protein BV25DRAFT_1822925 [Artomyces pyxidatus]